MAGDNQMALLRRPSRNIVETGQTPAADPLWLS